MNAPWGTENKKMNVSACSTSDWKQDRAYIDERTTRTEKMKIYVSERGTSESYDIVTVGVIERSAARWSLLLLSG